MAENEAEVLPQSLRGEGEFLRAGEHHHGSSQRVASSCLGAGSRNHNEGRRQEDVMVGSSFRKHLVL